MIYLDFKFKNTSQIAILGNAILVKIFKKLLECPLNMSVKAYLHSDITGDLVAIFLLESNITIKVDLN